MDVEFEENASPELFYWVRRKSIWVTQASPCSGRTAKSALRAKVPTMESAERLRNSRIDEPYQAREEGAKPRSPCCNLIA